MAKKSDIKYKDLAEKVSKSYRSNPNLIGIIWIGSSSFGITDDMTDIDIRLICAHKDTKFHMKQFTKEGIKIEVDQIDIEWLRQKLEPDSDQFWIREKAKILYDPHDVLKKEFYKLNKIDRKAYAKILWSIYKDIFHSYDFEKSIKRNDLMTSRMYVFKSINALSKFAFIYHEKPVPTFKWRWHFIKKYRLLRNSFIEQLKTIDLKNSDKSFNLIKNIEKQAQLMMLKKGYSSKLVHEPWLF
ncbi:hypothetical protein HY612_01390 [Candidatus Roizmanbacteria bacterium]|nr:hypothetical protein [Candidatus Roizmanbacteria bacterium]